ncbi:phage major capsid protein [Staphylococcus pseudintermedius]|uniref:phage major capsid protein n=1 Tax=Staphylococcus pseudintermedius TaxID=283734 RepID=UPI00036D3EB8|nr:phage major capsid protein [Staphylococcus pseudintermedius]EGQ1699971.1 phage major capsid protein [Staphylococcus pseudintermedius]EGQ1719245.1 phage major capsid protein [Staphylococcus pseudintermedius]EGQ3783692.1 phage major capsid protein [Staphylococcus pseudintermedius]EGQ4378071.1 phage major capsid protein [Staphylococcus pseudintermedius]ELK4007453.1 phage major capsid protein [Staphylococcus pseudintermedius]
MDKIEILLGKIEDTKRQIDLKVKFATRALDNDELEKAEKLEQEIADLRSELKDKEEELEKLKEEEENAEPEPVTVENNGRSTRSQFNAFDLGVMPETKVTSQEVRDFKAYLESRDDIKGGALKTDSGFVVIPEEIVTDIFKLKEVEFNLDKYVTVKKVTNGSGKYPVVRQSEVAALPEVEELAENPELAVKPFFELAYDIKTRRGYFRISREAIEDSQIDVLKELKLWLARTIAATRNKAIIDVIQNGGPGEKGGTTKLQTVVADGIDGLKDAVNLNVKPNYEHNVAIVSQTMFAKLDKLKDANGNYLIQPDVKEKSQQRLLGAKVEILPDEMLGEKGDEKLIFGNLKDALVLFDRSQYQASWTDYMHFGECLMVAVRQDVRILDYKAAIVIDYKESEPEEDELQTI